MTLLAFSTRMSQWESTQLYIKGVRWGCDHSCEYAKYFLQGVLFSVTWVFSVKDGPYALFVCSGLGSTQFVRHESNKDLFIATRSIGDQYRCCSHTKSPDTDELSCLCSCVQAWPHIMSLTHSNTGANDQDSALPVTRLTASSMTATSNFRLPSPWLVRPIMIELGKNSSVWQLSSAGLFTGLSYSIHSLYLLYMDMYRAKYDHRYLGFSLDGVLLDVSSIPGLFPHRGIKIITFLSSKKRWKKSKKKNSPNSDPLV